MNLFEQLQIAIKNGIQKGLNTSGINNITVRDSIFQNILDEISPLFRSNTNNLYSSNNQNLNQNVGEETTLWAGKPFLSLFTRYVITNQRIQIISGFIGKRYEDIPLIRITDVDLSTGIMERVFSIGDVHIKSVDPSRSNFSLVNISNPMQVKEIIRQAVLQAQKSNVIIFNQELNQR